MRLVATSALLLIVVCPVWGFEEPVDLDAVTRIRDEGMHRSRVTHSTRPILIWTTASAGSGAS